jgi:hypothetical protein
MSREATTHASLEGVSAEKGGEKEVLVNEIRNEIWSNIKKIKNSEKNGTSSSKKQKKP